MVDSKAPTPFLDKGELNGADSVSTDPGLKRAAHNRRRLAKVARLRRENLHLADALEDELRDRVRFAADCIGSEGAIMLNDAHSRILTLIGNQRGCCSKAVFREFFEPAAIGFAGGHTCKNKLCQVCNADRKSKLRKKYMNYFMDHPEIRQAADFLHLTLTVPHTAEGFRGNKQYGTELLALFNMMRKRKWWKSLVIGGELTTEFTRGPHGLHTHIHALVLVHKTRGSRNELHWRVLQEWNRLTVDPASRRTAFDQDQLAAIKRGLGAASAIADALDPRGATLVGLESLYVLSDAPRKGARQMPDGRWKRYIDTSNIKDFIGGVLECLKYHFEPMAFKKDGRWDVDGIFEIAPLLYRQRLYAKFGLFHGVKELNITDATPEEEIDQILANDGDVVTNPATGREADRAEYRFILADAGHARATEMEIRIRGPQQTIPADNLREAILWMVAAFSVAKKEKHKSKYNHDTNDDHRPPRRTGGGGRKGGAQVPQVQALQQPQGRGDLDPVLGDMLLFDLEPGNARQHGKRGAGSGHRLLP